MGTTFEIPTSDLFFYSEADEISFFSWLQSISAVRKVQGKGRTLFVELNSLTVSDDDLRELLSLFRRYGLGMSALAQFLTPENAEWFSDPNSYWHQAVFC